MGTGHNGGGPDHKLTEEAVLKAMAEARCIKSVAAARLKVHRSTLYRFLEANPHLREALDEIEEGAKDYVEGKMFQAIQRGDGNMIRFYLERRARDRGYGRSQEISGPGGGPIPVSDERTIDVEQLTDEEQMQLYRLHKKAKKQGNADDG